ncbi:hypothetical protein HN011_005564 [Eciton burchellii]|nr:hypothetical protein HN011_005564 [Eciton burchellii]
MPEPDNANRLRVVPSSVNQPRGLRSLEIRAYGLRKKMIADYADDRPVMEYSAAAGSTRSDSCQCVVNAA